MLTTPVSTAFISKAAAISALGVGVLRVLEDRLGRALLDDLAGAQHDHLVGERPHDLEVVADEQVGEAVLFLELAQQVDDLRLHRHVQRRGRLVQHDEARLEHQRPGDGDALALAARELVRVAVPPVRVDPDLAQRLDDPLVTLPAVADAVHDQALGDDLGDRHARAQGAVRVLEHHLHLAPERPYVARAQALDLAAVEGDGAGAALQPQERHAERRLARAGLADDADRVALAHRQRDAVDGADVVGGAPEHALLDREPDLDVAAGDDDGGVLGARRLAPLRLGRQEVLRVVVLRGIEDRFGVALLDDLAVGHHADPVGHAADDAEVVGDEQHRHAEALLQVLQQLEDLRLDGDVERRRRLVGDQQVRLVGQRHGDHHALPLAAGQLVRIGGQPLLGVADAHEIEQLEHAGAGLRRGHRLVHEEHLGNLLFHVVQRVQRGHRLLEDHRDVVAAHLAQRGFRGADQLLALESDRAARMARHRVGQQLQHRERGHRLAGAGLADQRHRLALADLERDVLDRLDRAAGRIEGDREVVDTEQLFFGHAIIPGSCADRTRRAPPRR